MIDVIIFSIVIIYLLIASIIDVKTHLIPDWLSYSFIILLLAIRGFYAIFTQDLMFFIWGLIGLLAAFLIGGLLYLTKQWGFGDTKLLLGLGIAFATPLVNKETILPLLPFLFLFFASIIVGFIYGMIYGIIIFIKNWKKAIIKFKKIFLFPKLIYSFALILLILFVVTFLVNSPWKNFLYIMILIFVLFYCLWVFSKTVELVGMKKRLSINKIEEGDVLVKDVMKNKKVLIKKQRLTKKLIAKLKRNKIKSVMVRWGLPFAPVLLGGAILTIIILYLI